MLTKEIFEQEINSILEKPPLETTYLCTMKEIQRKVQSLHFIREKKLSHAIMRVLSVAAVHHRIEMPKIEGTIIEYVKMLNENKTGDECRESIIDSLFSTYVLTRTAESGPVHNDISAQDLGSDDLPDGMESLCARSSWVP